MAFIALYFMPTHIKLPDVFNKHGNNMKMYG